MVHGYGYHDLISSTINEQSIKQRGIGYNGAILYYDLEPNETEDRQTNQLSFNLPPLIQLVML